MLLIRVLECMPHATKSSDSERRALGHGVCMPVRRSTPLHLCRARPLVRYRFKSWMLREVVYNSLPFEQRRLLHKARGFTPIYTHSSCAIPPIQGMPF